MVKQVFGCPRPRHRRKPQNHIQNFGYMPLYRTPAGFLQIILVILLLGVCQIMRFAVLIGRHRHHYG